MWFALWWAGVAFVITYLFAFIMSEKQSSRLMASALIAIIVGVTAYAAHTIPVAGMN